MLSAPIFVYSEKAAKEYLTTLALNKTTNDLDLLTLKGVEYSTEEDYFKVQNFFLTESFDTSTYLDTSASDALTTTNLYRALWGSNTSTVNGTTVAGTSGYLSCAYYEDTESPKTAELTFDAITSLRSVNAAIGASNVTLGSAITNVLTTARGNYLTGQNSYQNNPTFYPFAINPGGTSRSYGSNTNAVPSNGYVKDIRLISNASQTPGNYKSGHTLNLKFDLWNGTQFIGSKNIELLDADQSLLNINSVVHSVASEQDYFLASTIRFLNVQLVNTSKSTGVETAATDYYSLLLDTDAQYYSTSNVNLTTKPFIESSTFLLKDALNAEFSGFDSITITDVANPNNGLEIEVKLSSTEIGLESSNYVRLGSVTTAGTSTVYLRLDDPAYEAARNAKYVKVRISGIINTSTNTYLQSSFNKAITLNQINLNRKQVLGTDFTGQIKFGNGYEENNPNILFGPFDIFMNKVEEMPALGTYKLGGSTSYTYKNFISLNQVREGRLQYNFSNYQKIYYIAKGSVNNINTNLVPTYTPSVAAVAKFNSAPNRNPTLPTGYTKRLVLKYDVTVAQLNDPHWISCQGWTSNTLVNKYGFHNAGSSIINGTEATKTAIVDANANNNYTGGTLITNSNTAKRYLLEFFVNKTNNENFRKFFGFKFTNFREVVVYQNNTNPNDIQEADQTFWIRYKNNDPKTSYATGAADGTFGLWYANSNQKFINTLESEEFFINSPHSITRVALPAFTFDKFEGLATDGVARDFEARALIRYYNSSNQIIDNTNVVKAYTESRVHETVIETPTAAASAACKKIGIKYVLIPKNVPVAEVLASLSDFSINNVLLTRDKHLIPTATYFNDVGINFSSKPRVEYLDDASNTATKYKRYVKSIIVSKEYDVYNFTGGLTPEGENPSLVRTEVIYGGSVSKPDGTDIVVEWCGKTTTGQTCSALDWKATTSDNTVKNARYLFFKVTLTPTVDGRKAPLVDLVSIRFWPYNEPYVAYAVEDLAQNVSNVILSKFETQDVERDLSQLELDVSIDDADPAYVISGLDHEQNIMQDISVSDRGNNVTVKAIFLHEDARLRDAAVDLFYVTP